MLLSDIFDQLSYGELSHVHIGGNGTGINRGDYPQLVSHINAALMDLHTRLPLKVDSLIIQLHDWIQSYYLRVQYAQTNSESSESIKYIMDSPFKTFKGNILKVEQVFSEIGVEYPLNDPVQNYSVFTPQYDLLSVPFADRENVLSVAYRAGHPKISVTPESDPDKIEVDLPAYLQEAVCTYVGARVMSGMGSGDNQQESAVLMHRYNTFLAQLEINGVVNTDTMINTKLEKNGWV